jgi:AcrR family transcriptional regulator
MVLWYTTSYSQYRRFRPVPAPEGAHWGMTSSPYTVHERIIHAATPLFTQRGIRQVTKEEVQRVAGITGHEFDLEFTSRDDLATEVLERRENTWTTGIVEAGARARSTTAEGRLLAIFDVLDEWFHRHDYEALSRVDTLLNMGDEHPLGRANVGYLREMRHLAARLAMEARLDDPAEFALSWHVLVTGSITNAIEGDDRAASRAKEMGAALIAKHRPPRIALPFTAEQSDDLADANRAVDDLEFHDAYAAVGVAQGSSLMVDEWDL